MALLHVVMVESSREGATVVLRRPPRRWNVQAGPVVTDSGRRAATGVLFGGIPSKPTGQRVPCDASARQQINPS